MNKHFRTRPYEPEDAPRIARLFFDSVRHVNPGDYTRRQVRAWAPKVPDERTWHERMSMRITLVAEDERGVIAFAEMEDNGHLDMFYVHWEAVRRGVGTALYEALEREARGMKLGLVFTEASIKARPFFEARGFRTLKEQEVILEGISLANFAMEKRLV